MVDLSSSPARGVRHVGYRRGQVGVAGGIIVEPPSIRESRVAEVSPHGPETFLDQRGQPGHRRRHADLGDLGLASPPARRFRYGTGHGVPQDDAEAVRWYRLAVVQGDADAQFNLGWMYENGRGVHRTAPKPRAGTGWRLSRGRPRRCSNSGPAMATARASRLAPVTRGFSVPVSQGAPVSRVGHVLS